MTPQDKVDRIEYIIRCEQVGISILKEAIVVAQCLHVPGTGTQIAAIFRYTVRGLHFHLLILVANRQQCLTHSLSEFRIVHGLVKAADKPSEAIDMFYYIVLFGKDIVFISILSGSQIKFDCRMYSGSFNPFVRAGNLIQFFSCIQCLSAQCIVEILQHTGDGGQLGSRCQFAIWVIFSKHPTVVGITGHVIRMGTGISQVDILADTVTDNPPVKASQRPVTGYDCQCTIFHLLQKVRFAVRLMYFRDTFMMVDSRGIVIYTEMFIRQRQDIGLSCLRFDTQVIVAGIMPATDSQTGNVIPRLIVRQRGRS